MEVLASLRRIRTRMYSMERGLRSLRSEVEAALLAFDDDSTIETQRIACGLSTLLSAPSDVPMTAVSPYEEFSPGVWCSYDEAAAGASMHVMTRALGRIDPRSEVPHVSRLVVHPVFTTAEKPLWCTLEFKIDAEPVKAAKALRIDVGCFFSIPSTNTTPLPQTMKFILRLQVTGGTRDVLERHLPVTTMSFDHAIDLTEAAMKEIQFSDCTGVVGILALPQAGTFNFNVERFTVHALNR